MICFCLLISCGQQQPVQQEVQLPESETFSFALSDTMSDFEKAVILRRMVADTIDSGDITDSLFENFTQTPFENFKVEPYLQKFAANAGHTSCGLAANILCKLLNNNDIEAYTYNFGFASTVLTHVVVLTRTNKDMWTVHDPTFNYSLLDSADKPKEFFEFLSEIKRGEFANFHPTQDTVWRELLLSKQALQHIEELSDTCVKYINEIYIQTDTANHVLVPVCYTCELDNSICSQLNFKQNMEAKLAENNLPPHFHYAYTLQINSVWGPDPTTFQSKLDSVFVELQ